MSAIEALLDLIGWLFGRRPDEDAASPPEKLGMRYREIAEARPPSGAGCLLVVAMPGLAVVGVTGGAVAAVIATALTGGAETSSGAVGLAAVAGWIAVFFAASVWLIRNARRPGRIDPVLILTVAIVIDLLFLLPVFVAGRT